MEYLNDLSIHKPTELKILLIDNAGFHSTKDINLPENIILIPIPAYTPELNPAEKIWQYLKDKVAMKIFESLENLELKIISTINTITKQEIISITAYDFIIKNYNSIFI